MKTHAIRFLVLLAIGLGVGLAHGLVGGLDMPRKPKTSVPGAAPAPVAHAEPAAMDPVAPETVEAAISEELKNLRAHVENGTAIVLDARTFDEYAEGHIPSAFHAPFEAFIGQVPDYMDMLLADPDQLIIVYCGGGDCHASESVGSQLMEYGIENVFVFEGGYPAWTEAGFAVETGGGSW